MEPVLRARVEDYSVALAEQNECVVQQADLMMSSRTTKHSVLSSEWKRAGDKEQQLSKLSQVQIKVEESNQTEHPGFEI